MNAQALPKVIVPFAISPSDLEAWVAASDPGDDIVYAYGPSTPRHAPVWTLAGELQREGVIDLFAPRRDYGWDFIARRKNAPMVETIATTPIDLSEVDFEGLILREIRRAAQFGLPCPSNGVLAQRCGLKDAAAASYRIGKLIAEGAIQVENFGPNAPRVATIVGTGLSTARPA